eukprot:14298746-Alexandrium_andersonii.AAC.1
MHGSRHDCDQVPGGQHDRFGPNGEQYQADRQKGPERGEHEAMQRVRAATPAGTTRQEKLAMSR